MCEKTCIREACCLGLAQEQLDFGAILLPPWVRKLCSAPLSSFLPVTSENPWQEMSHFSLCKSCIFWDQSKFGLEDLSFCSGVGHLPGWV